MLKKIKLVVKKLCRTLGYDIVLKKPNIIDFLSYHKIDTVFDVGANIGQYGKQLRESGYKGRIISFEPLSEAFKELEAISHHDPLWETLNIGLGNYDGKAQINISQSTVFSSILNILPRIREFDQGSIQISKEEILLNKLDSLMDGFYKPNSIYFLKVDTQGFEKEVIEGAINSLRYFQGIQLELAPIPVYEGQASLIEMLNLMESNGFRIALIEPVNYHNVEPSLLEFDCIFVK